MLFLTRYPGQSILLGANIKVHVVGVDRGAVTLTVEVGSAVPITFDRYLDETFDLGANICIGIARIRGPKVKLSIEAPDSVPIFRDELIAEVRARRELPDLVPARRSTNVLVGA